MDGIRSAEDILIDLIYAAMLGEAPWQAVLDQMSARRPGISPFIFSHYPSRDDGLVAPHLKCASDFHRSGPELRATTEFDASLFDAVHIGMMFLTEECTIKSVSETMQQMIEENAKAGLSPVCISPDGKLSLGEYDAHAALERMMLQGYCGPKSVAFRCGDDRLTLVHVQMDGLSLYCGVPTVILLFERAKGCGGLDAAGFSAAYGLTSAERRALEGLVSGMSVREIAEAAGVSRETIRSQVKSLYLKAGVRSEADLLRLLLGVVG